MKLCEYNAIHSSNTTGATGGEETAYLSRAPKLAPDFIGVRVVYCVVFCESLFVLFLLAIVLSVLLITPLVTSNFSMCLSKI